MKKLLLKIITIVAASIFIYGIRTQIFPDVPDSVLRIIGIVVGALAVLYLVMEQRANLPYFYGRSQSAGSNANASVVAGLAVALISNSWFGVLIGSLVGVGLII